MGTDSNDRRTPRGGDHDLVIDHMRRSGELMAGPWRYERIDGASHRVPLDAPDRLSQLPVEFPSTEDTA